MKEDACLNKQTSIILGQLLTDGSIQNAANIV